MLQGLKAAVVGFIIAVLLFLSPAGAAEWDSVSALSTARDQFTAGVIGNKFYVFGGNGNPDGRNLSSLEIYDIPTDSWSFGASNPHNAGLGVEELSGAVMDGKLYVFGAWGGSGVINFVEEYDPAADQWRSLPPKPTAVSSAPAAAYNGEVFVFGGMYTSGSSSTEIHYTVVEAYNPSTDSWRTVANMPKAFQMAAVSVYQDTAYLIGGFYFQSDQIVIQTDVISYHFPTGTWTTSGLGSLSGFRAFPYATPAPVVNGTICLAGGFGLIDPGGTLDQSNAAPVSEFLFYEIETGIFSQGPSLPTPRDDHAVLLADGYLYAISGRTEWTDAGRTNQVNRLLAAPQTSLCDVDGDGAAGLAEAIWILQDLSGVR